MGVPLVWTVCHIESGVAWYRVSPLKTVANFSVYLKSCSAVAESQVCRAKLPLFDTVVLTIRILVFQGGLIPEGVGLVARLCGYGRFGVKFLFEMENEACRAVGQDGAFGSGLGSGCRLAGVIGLGFGRGS